MVKSLEIVGLHIGNNHCSCYMHKVFGSTIQVGNRLSLVTCTVDHEDGMVEFGED
jgi:hypothetical protein